MAAKKKPAAKKPASKSQAASRSKTGSRPAPKREENAARSRAKRQAAAVILFAAAVLLLCLALIPGASLWGMLHNLILGMFGLCAYILPVLLIYIAVATAADKPAGSVGSKLWQCGVLMVLGTAAVQVFSADVTGSFFAALMDSYAAGGRSSGGGVFGAMIGYPMEYFFTDIGAKIILLLLIFVFLMLMTGTTILTLFHAIWKPVKKTKETIENAMIAGEEKRQAASDAPMIDIDMGDGYMEMPQHPVQSEKNEPSPKLQAFAKAAREMKAEEEAEKAILMGKKKEEPAPDIELAPGRLTRLGEEPSRDGKRLSRVEEALNSLEEPREEKTREDAVPVDSKTVIDNPFASAAASPEADAEGKHYLYPPVSLLDEVKEGGQAASRKDQQQTAELLVNTLKEFGVQTSLVGVSHGPSVTRYELQPNAGVKISRITGLADDIALRLAATGVRIEAPIPGKAAVGIEVPNKVSSPVCLRELVDSPEFRSAKSKLTVALGKDISGRIVLADLAKMPHLLIAGTTGSGKSVCTNSMIQSVLFRATPDEVRILLIDPKQVEFGIYNGIPHLLVPVVTDPRKAAGALGWAVTEMLNRYKTFADNNVRDLESYNELARRSDTLKPMPLILIVIDELSDLMMAAANEVEDAIIRLAQMARAAGMHLVIATQRPSVDVITGLIKANIPSRLALTVASQVDSRTILDAGGAEKLLGRGDMLFMPVGVSKPMRIQGCFVSNREVESVVDFLKSGGQESAYDEEVAEKINELAENSGKNASKKGDDDFDGEGDDMLPQAIEVVVEAGQASTSLLQRRLRLGYARAGRIIDELEQRGIIGPHEGSKPRQVLITRQQMIEMNLNQPEE